LRHRSIRSTPCWRDCSSPAFRDQLDSLLNEAARANLSARETLILLCEREIALEAGEFLKQKNPNSHVAVRERDETIIIE
jgi:hypothetical protein